MNINLLGLENKSFMVRKISYVNLPLNSEVDEWMSRSSDTLKNIQNLEESKTHFDQSWWRGGGEGKPECRNTIWKALLLYFSCLHREAALKAGMVQKPHILRVLSLQPFIFMIIYLSLKILQFQKLGSLAECWVRGIRTRWVKNRFQSWS